jgi:hypothetical protein
VRAFNPGDVLALSAYERHVNVVAMRRRWLRELRAGDGGWIEPLALTFLIQAARRGSNVRGQG